jgi:hypothetical protein
MERIKIIEYSENLLKLQNGLISEEEWMVYCKEILSEVLEDSKDVMIRLKNRGDQYEIR